MTTITALDCIYQLMLLCVPLPEKNPQVINNAAYFMKLFLRYL